MSRLDDLARADAEAAAAFDEARKRWEAREAELRKEARARLEAELGAEFRAAQAARAATDRAYRAERERVDVEAALAGIPHPEGTVLVEWRPQSYNWEGRSFRRTGQKGVMQVKRSGDPHPDNQRYERIANGAVVVRHLTASGQPGKRCVRYAKGLWLPEGVVHERCLLRPCPSCGKDRPADGVGRDMFEPGHACPQCGHVEQVAKG